MTIGTVKSQGTRLYFIDRLLQSSPVLRYVVCATGIDGVGGGAKDQVDITCLDTQGMKQNRAGLGNPSVVSAPINFIPTAEAHQALMAYKEAGNSTRWMMLAPDGANPEAEPTIDSNEMIEAPADRTTASFDGFVNEVPINVGTNDIWRGTLNIQVSGNTDWTYATTEPTE
jgi:hypothetical protein